MKIKDIKSLGLLAVTKKEANIDAAGLVVSDEFNRKGKKTSYRQRAIDRLIKLLIPFHSECNIIYDMVERFIKVSCPYCKDVMVKEGWCGGCADSNTCNFVCRCGAESSITMPSNGITFTPPKQDS